MALMADMTGPHVFEQVEERPLTVDDLETMPDDGRRYELLDGSLLVTPAPGYRHQRVVLLLGMLLEEKCPEGFSVLPAPFALRTSSTSELKPDVLVAPDEDFTETHLPVPPTLVVEVLSRSTALHDRNSKKALYEELGVECYWVIDPAIPSVEVHELDDEGHYQQIAEVKGSDAFEAERPFPVRVVPAELSKRRGDE